MAQVVGFEDAAIYAFLPRLFNPDSSNNYMKQVTLGR
jgi:hypothetical protein